MTATEAIAALWGGLALPDDVPSWATLTGDEPALPSSFRVGTAAQASIAAAGLAAASLWRLRGGAAQEVAVDMRHAAIEFRSERLVRVNDAPMPDLWDKIAGAYPCADAGPRGGWVRLHTNFPHHREGVLRLLDSAYDRDAVAAALRSWPAEAFETAAAQAGMAVTALRDFATWDAHPQGRAVAARPLVSLERIGEAPAEALPPGGTRPLEGVRVLDLTRVIAGPVCGRTLAAHGAEVLAITPPHLPLVRIEDTARGKRAAELDLRDPAARDTLAGLVRGADVFVQGYRPGGLAALGFGPEALAALRPGIVCVSLTAFGADGPWAGRHGFDSLTQTATGLNVAEAEAAGEDRPRVLPAQALDHASGYLMALGAMAGLHRRVTEGGSWHVQVSLARTGLWLRSLGRLEHGQAAPDPTPEDVADLMEESDSGWGRLTAVRHAARLARTPARWTRGPVRPGTDPAAWT